ncbi:MAG: hypothetical protein RR747_05575, partial [Gordonibacter sp.]
VPEPGGEGFDAIVFSTRSLFSAIVCGHSADHRRLLHGENLVSVFGDQRTLPRRHPAPFVIEQIVIKLWMLLHEQMFLPLLWLRCARMDDCMDMIVFQ